MKENIGQVQYSCPHCGRRWIARTQAPGSYTGWSGFLRASVNVHVKNCARRTRDERLESAKTDKKRWDKRALLHTIVIDTAEYGNLSSFPLFEPMDTEEKDASLPS